MNAGDWIALAVGAVFGLLVYGALHAAKRRLAKAIAAGVCPLCGCRATIPPDRSFSDGAAQLIDQLDRQKEQQ